MGKLIQFPIARIRSRRSASIGVFNAFGELHDIERKQAQLLTASAGVALLCVLALQLLLG